MKLSQLLEHLQYEVVRGSDQILVTELLNDSRRVCAGSVFVSSRCCATTPWPAPWNS